MNSILEDLSWQYQKSDSFIFDDIKKQILYIYPAGYTQMFFKKRLDIEGVSCCEQVNRQELFKKLYRQADGQLFPFEDCRYDLYLEHDPKNKYDKDAIKIVLTAKDDPDAEYWIDYFIGFVPAKINKVVLKNMYSIEDIRILSVANNLNDKFYCTRIAISYGDTQIRNEGISEKALVII